MSKAIPRRAIIVVTSYNEVFYDDGKRTGLWFTEALHPFNVLTEAGFEVDLASETGTYGFDEHSLSKEFLSEEDEAVYNDSAHPFMTKLNKQLRKASDVAKDEYGIFFASGGHGTIFDFPHDRGLQHIAEAIYSRSGIVSAVCHGPAILPGVNDHTTGRSIISGKAITGFPTEGEIALKLLDKIKAEKLKTIEEEAAGAEAKYLAPLQPFDDFSVSDGRIVTGANPASARSTAARAVKAFDAL